MGKHKKNRLLTYLFSFMPGLGFMYQNRMKRGLSYLTAFLGSIVIVDVLGISVLGIVPVILWFYSFFDQINTFSLPEQDLIQVKDEVIFQKKIANIQIEDLLKDQKLIGGLLAFLGGYLLLKRAYIGVVSLLPRIISIKLLNLLNGMPAMVMAGMILYAGICLLQGKTKLFERVIELKARTKTASTEKDLLTQANPVYYMNGDTSESDQLLHGKVVSMRENELENSNVIRMQELHSEIRSQKEIIDDSDREQLLHKAEELLNHEIYQNIHNDKKEDSL